MAPEKTATTATTKNTHGGGDADADPFEFCDVCNLNHSLGRRHKHLPRHRRSLAALLSRFQSKLSDLRFFLKNPSPLRPELSALNCLWCVFCGVDLREISSSFACANAIRHMASEEHVRNFKRFMWKHGGDMDRLESFRVSEADLRKWEKSCSSFVNSTSSSSGHIGPLSHPTQDIQIERTSNATDSFKNNSSFSFISSFSCGVMPLQRPTNEEYQVCHPETSQPVITGPVLYSAASSSIGMKASVNLWNMNVSGTALLHSSGTQATVHGKKGNGSVAWSESNRLDQGAFSAEDSRQGCPGNVHTGAPPPWLETSEDNESHILSKALQINSFSVPMAQKGKAKKLNPNRVGAAWAEKRRIELELEKKGEIGPSHCDANWLPNFGRVWQTGTRKESKKEFEIEKQKFFKDENQSDMAFVVQPYISKRMRTSSLENGGAANVQG